MKHIKSGRERHAMKRVAGELQSRVQIGFGKEEAGKKAEYLLEPYIASGIRDGEFEEIASRVGAIWALSAESLASRHERLYGKASAAEVLRESSRALLAVAYVSMLAERQKEAAEWLLSHLEPLPTSIHWDFILLNAAAAGREEAAVEENKNVRNALRAAFSENKRLAAMLEEYVEKRSEG